MTKPGGLILTGEPYWIVDPADEYLRLENLGRDEFPRIEAYSQGARDMGLSLVWMRRATGAEWDRYEMLQSASFDAFLQEHPDHPDREEIRSQLMPGKEAYIRWGKDCCGFALWVWRKPAA
jgi:hypothetical protein